jgi:molecular chaperone DnaJ
VQGITHYERIGVSPDASRDQIRAAYRRLARRHHPDANDGDTSQMAALNEAWRVLSDPTRRAVYDSSLRGAARAPTVAAAPEPDDEFDEDFDDDDRPLSGHRGGGFPLPVLALLVLFAMIFVITAYAYERSGTVNGPAPTIPVDGVIEIGSCVRVGDDAVAAETPCGAPYVGVVVAFIARDGRCPPSTDGFRDPRSDGYVCIHR